MNPKVAIDHQQLADFCRKWGVRELALFGSVLRDDFDPDRSDVDVLVEFEPAARISLFDMSRMQDELEALFGRPVDLGTKRSLKPLIRDEVLESAVTVYGAA